MSGQPDLPSIEDVLDADDADADENTRWALAVVDGDGTATVTHRIYQGPTPPEVC